MDSSPQPFPSPHPMLVDTEDEPLSSPPNPRLDPSTQKHAVCSDATPSRTGPLTVPPLSRPPSPHGTLNARPSPLSSQAEVPSTASVNTRCPVALHLRFSRDRQDCPRHRYPPSLARRYRVDHSSRQLYGSLYYSGRLASSLDPGCCRVMPTVEER